MLRRTDWSILVNQRTVRTMGSSLVSLTNVEQKEKEIFLIEFPHTIIDP